MTTTTTTTTMQTTTTTTTDMINKYKTFVDFYQPFVESVRWDISRNEVIAFYRYALSPRTRENRRVLFIIPVKREEMPRVVKAMRNRRVSVREVLKLAESVKDEKRWAEQREYREDDLEKFDLRRFCQEKGEWLRRRKQKYDDRRDLLAEKITPFQQQKQGWKSNKERWIGEQVVEMSKTLGIAPPELVLVNKTAGSKELGRQWGGQAIHSEHKIIVRTRSCSIRRLRHVIAHELIHLAFPKLAHGGSFEYYYVSSLLRGHLVFGGRGIIMEVTKKPDEEEEQEA
jgi:predicted metal-dependent hydrolase